MPQKNRKEEIIEAIRKHLAIAIKRPESITDERLMEVAECSRRTFYKYVTKGSEIEGEIEAARLQQRTHVELADQGGGANVPDIDLRKQLEEAKAGNRELLALLARMTANLIIKFGVKAEVIQAAQGEEIPHPNRSFSYAGKGRRKKRY